MRLEDLVEEELNLKQAVNENELILCSMEVINNEIMRSTLSKRWPLQFT